MSVGSDGGMGELAGSGADPGPVAMSALGGGGGLGGAFAPLASDTGNILAGLGMGSAGQSFTIDVDQAPRAITDLEAAANFLEGRAARAHQLTNIPPPGIDGVSLHAVEQIGKWASDSGVNNLEATLRAGVGQLRTLARKLREDLQVYLQVDKLALPDPSDGLLR
ncbi:MAG: hypothetical protein ACRDTC_14580 [Pseudonocardiaceae bacterium]